jgi:hypothetical protein
MNKDNILASITNVDSGNSLQAWKNNSELTQQLRLELMDANVLFLPVERYEEKAFAPDAESFFQFLQQLNRQDINVDMCVNDGEYRRLALNAEPISLTVLGTIVVSSFIAPLFKDLLLDYIRARRANKSKSTSEIRVSLIIDNENGFIQSIDFSGDSTKFEETFSALVEKVLEYGKNSGRMRALEAESDKDL